MSQTLVLDLSKGVITGHKKAVKKKTAGWNHDSKKEARKWVWGELLGRYKVVPPHNLDEINVLTLVGDGKEIPLLVKMGISESRIWAVDRDPAMFNPAKMKWMSKYPGVKIRMCPLSEAIIAQQSIHNAHLDFCSTLSDGFIRELEAFCRSNVMDPYGRVAVTFVRARDVFSCLGSRLYVENYLKPQFGDENWRMEYILDVFNQHYKLNYHTDYKYQTKSPMQIVVMELRGLRK